MSDQTIHEKIKKLLRLANNSGATEAEAANAMQMASALMLKHNISVDLSEDGEIKIIRGETVVEDCSETWHRVCATTVALLYSCRVIVMNGGGFEFVGRTDNIDDCNQTLPYIITQVELLYKMALPRGLSKSARADFRKTFKMACASRCHRRAYEIMEQMRNDDAKALEYTGSTALVVVKNIDAMRKEADEFMGTQKLRNLPAVRQRFGSGTLAGHRAGDNVQLNRRVDE